MGYDWRVGTFRNQGTISPPGYSGVNFSPGAIGAPSTTSKLVRVGLSLYYHVAGTNPSASITPDWPWFQSGYVCAAVQAAGDPTVPSPTDPAPSGLKVNAPLIVRPWSFGFSTSQGICALQTDGMVWSQGEDRTPPGGGLQVRPSFQINDASATIAIFGSAFRWGYELQARVLWFT